VVVHAYRDAPVGPIDVTAGVSEGWLSVAVRDRGSGIVPRVDSPGLGLGLPLIAQVADTLHVSEPVGGGTELRMTFRTAGRELT
jgi:serine/threonine-protein kinase RsbW/stage II sporulation protein AB (anti-sigma F factor)